MNKSLSFVPMALCCLTLSSLAAPTVTSLTPAAAVEGRIMLATIEGTGFVSGATVTFEAGGIEDARTAAETISTEVKSATKLEVYLNVTAGSFTGAARDLTVTNNDGSGSGVLLGALNVTSNSGATVINRPKFSAPGGLTDYTSGLAIDPTTLYFSAVVSADAGLSTGQINAKVLLDHQLFADNLGSRFSPEAGAKTGTFYYHADYAAGTTGDHIVSLYAEDDSGTPDIYDCLVSIAAPTAEAKVTYSPVLPSANKDPTAADPVVLQFKIDGPVTRPLTLRIHGSSMVFSRVISPAKILSALAATTEAGYVDEPWDGRTNIGRPARSGIYIVTVDDGEQIRAKGKLVIFRP
ncbi:hypothetical protein A2625_04155 [candidate division WOR-1 bacterium RIFCSPHIGHO2_01_FULL_53_15]|uniref:FlgD Ig-like domain-containing protein n=1 Tax=candidate division WOR-1 bacterium RIFCSPHIGHO2_01_FULL_53_15 TaxID=1802564 RepID=A0A1F4Q206_UNCSA|nr:MAG: hypothetical protein A2625_04155 [candidate division WOR-1 bacterium RIFCSPHIGHO2_01_FULL_53_15]